MTCQQQSLKFHNFVQYLFLKCLIYSEGNMSLVIMPELKLNVFSLTHTEIEILFFNCLIALYTLDLSLLKYIFMLSPYYNGHYIRIRFLRYLENAIFICPYFLCLTFSALKSLVNSSKRKPSCPVRCNYNRATLL